MYSLHNVQAPFPGQANKHRSSLLILNMILEDSPLSLLLNYTQIPSNVLSNAMEVGKCLVVAATVHHAPSLSSISHAHLWQYPTKQETKMKQELLYREMTHTYSGSITSVSLLRSQYAIVLLKCGLPTVIKTKY